MIGPALLQNRRRKCRKYRKSARQSVTCIFGNDLKGLGYRWPNARRLPEPWRKLAEIGGYSVQKHFRPSASPAECPPGPNPLMPAPRPSAK
jgi:hypothetical protein